jgi:hypothetical protein
VEVVLAAVVVSVILLGMHSAIMLAWRASPDRKSANYCAASAGKALDLLSQDLALATSISTTPTNAIEFEVPDRTGDGAPDTMCYSWSGVKGEPLLRSINGSDGGLITPNIAEFQLTYNKRAQAQPTTYTESGEVTLCYYDSLSLLNLGNFAIDSNDFVGEYFKPSLPNGVTQFRVTRAMIRARANGSATGDALVQIRTANGVLPAAILDQATLLESALDSAGLLSDGYTWRQFLFSNVPARPAGSGLCLVVVTSNSSSACDIEYQGLLAGGVNCDFVKTSNAGASWSAPSGQDLRYYVYGTYITPNPTTYTYWLTGVSCKLRKGDDPSAKVRTTIRMLNEPQVTGP